MKGGGKGDGAIEAVARKAKRRSGKVTGWKSARENQEAAGKRSTWHRPGIAEIEEGFLASETPLGTGRSLPASG
jgi:hypothetical protein